MATNVHMEALSPTMEEGQVVKWHKAEGDTVAEGELLAEVETDKATMELMSRATGTLRRIITGEGATAPVGAIIAVIGTADEDLRDVVDVVPDVDGREAKEEAESRKKPETEDKRGIGERPTETYKKKSDKEIGATIPTAYGSRVKASPLARRLAAAVGVELFQVRGSGPGGRIVKRDVMEAAEHVRARLPSGTMAAADGGEPASPDYDDIKLSQMRKTIAHRLTESLGPVPHFFLTIQVDMDRAGQARERINALLEKRDERVSLNDLLIRAAAGALRQHPAVNASWQGDYVRRYRRVHVGVAVAVDDGLITPVIRDADRKGVAEIAREVRMLAARARAKKLAPEEYTGATFSISNLGMFGIHQFTAVINPPEVAILAVGHVEEVPVVMGGQVVVRPRMRATMSCDHRVVDGAVGARFLQTLKAMLEDPAAVLS